jgi:hypothetical protein
MPQQATAFGRSISPPSDAWLTKQPPEAILDPALPIIDTHHHFWDRLDHRYLLDELCADLATGHNIVATVFLECRSMYRAAGPAEMPPVGETEFVAGIAAMNASARRSEASPDAAGVAAGNAESGGYGPTRVATGIVGPRRCDLGRSGRAGARSAYPSRRGAVLRRAPLGRPGRERGHRQQPRGYAAASLSAAGLPAGCRAPRRPRPSRDARRYHPQLAGVVDPVRGVPAATIIVGSRRPGARPRWLAISILANSILD